MASGQSKLISATKLPHHIAKKGNKDGRHLQ